MAAAIERVGDEWFAVEAVAQEARIHREGRSNDLPLAVGDGVHSGRPWVAVRERGGVVVVPTLGVGVGARVSGVHMNSHAVGRGAVRCVQARLKTMIVGEGAPQHVPIVAQVDDRLSAFASSADFREVRVEALTSRQQ